MTSRSPAEPTPAEVKRAVAAGDLVAIHRYTREFGPASLNLNDDPDELTALHYAAINDRASVCAALIKVDANVNARTEPQGYAPPHSAALAGHIETIRLLLANGTDPALLNYRKETPAETVARAGQLAANAMLGPHSP